MFTIMSSSLRKLSANKRGMHHIQEAGPRHSNKCGETSMNAESCGTSSCHNMDGNGGHHGHSMTFNYNYPGSVLFDQLNVHSSLSMALVCVLMFVLGMASEGLKYLEARTGNKERKIRTALCHLKMAEYNTNGNNTTDDTLNNGFTGERLPNSCKTRSADIARASKKIFFSSWKAWIGPHLARTLIFGIRTTLNYFLMLASMTFNVEIFTSIMLGFTVGFFIVALLPNPSGTPDCELVGQDCC